MDRCVFAKLILAGRRVSVTTGREKLATMMTDAGFDLLSEKVIAIHITDMLDAFNNSARPSSGLYLSDMSAYASSLVESTFHSRRSIVSLVLIHRMSFLPLAHSLLRFLLRRILFALRPISFLMTTKLS